MNISINLQLKILAWIYALLVIFYAALIWQTYDVYGVLKIRDEWARHSTEVFNLSASAKNLFLEAETKGRLASFDGSARNEFPSYAKNSISAAKSLNNTVKDNPVQAEHAKKILAAVESRFAAQERTINAAMIVDGKLQSNPELVKQGVAAQTEAINAFLLFESEERALLIERYNDLWAALRKMAAFIAVIVGLSFSANLFSGGWTWRTLRKATAAMLAMPDKEQVGYLEEANKDLTEENKTLRNILGNVSKILDS